MLQALLRANVPDPFASGLPRPSSRRPRPCRACDRGRPSVPCCRRARSCCRARLAVRHFPSRPPSLLTPESLQRAEAFSLRLTAFCLPTSVLSSPRRAARRRLALGRGDLAGLHELLEAAQVFRDLLFGVLAEEP